MRYKLEGCLKEQYNLNNEEVYILINKLETYMYDTFDFEGYINKNIEYYGIHNKKQLETLGCCMNERKDVAEISKVLGISYQNVFIMRHTILEDIIGGMTKEELFEVINKNCDLFLG